MGLDGSIHGSARDLNACELLRCGHLQQHEVRPGAVRRFEIIVRARDTAPRAGVQVPCEETELNQIGGDSSVPHIVAH